jgi:hypothetical protein
MVPHHSGRNDDHRILFPFHGFTPAIGLGMMSLPFLALTIFARYPNHLVLLITALFGVVAATRFHPEPRVVTN